MKRCVCAAGASNNADDYPIRLVLSSYYWQENSAGLFVFIQMQVLAVWYDLFLFNASNYE
jgi:hypothetical protein